MSKTLPDFVSDEPIVTPAAEAPAESAPAPVEAAAESPQPAETEAKGPARGPDGKFAPVKPAEPAPQAAPVADAAHAAPPPVAPPAPQPEAQAVPLATFLDVRDRAAAAEKRAKELEDWRQQQEAQARRQPVPSFAENPEAAVAFQQQQFQAALFEQKRDFSRRLAEVTHGKDTVDTAFNWAADLIDQQLRQSGRSALNEDLLRHADPMGFVVDQWRRDQIAAKVDPAKLEAFLAWEAAQAAAAQMPAAQAQPSAQPAPAAAPPPPPAAPRQSLASAPSAATSGAPIPRDGESTYHALFGT